MNLPSSENLTTSLLTGVFANTSATYKFYWFLAIIEAVENGKQQITKRELFARMISNSWYTVNYFKVSFGKQDLIQSAVREIKDIEGLSIDIRREELQAILETTASRQTAQILNHFNINVPHWFLTPWLQRTPGVTDSEYKREIYAASQIYQNGCLYTLHDDYLIVNPQWLNYLQQNAGILKAFCYWHLSLFLHVRNPNVPDIPNKLIKPALRSPLTNQRAYWNVVFKELGSIECIITGSKLVAADYALDHFIPHAFVSHNLIWNLTPIDTSFNSYKSDRLPSMDLHFDQFYELQKTAYEIVSFHNDKNKNLEDYLSIFPTLKNSAEFEYDRFKENFEPLIMIAQNNGFRTMT